VSRAHEPALGVALVWADDVSSQPAVIVSNRGLVFVDAQADPIALELRCHEALEVPISRPPIARLRSDGSLLVSTFHGVYASTDRGCTRAATRGLPEEVPLGPPTQTEGGLLLATRSIEPASVVMFSPDEGATWTERYACAAGEYFETLLSAPSAPSRVYATGLLFEAGARSAICAVSDDAGQSFERRGVRGGVVLFAVHPGNPDVVFAYEPSDLQGTRYRVLRSEDACQSFVPVLEDVAAPSGLSGPGEGPLFLGIAGAGGLYRSDDHGQSFARVLSEQVNSVSCVVQRASRLWLCANLAPNSFGVWFSADQAQTLEPFMTFAQVTRPVACDAASDRATCAGPWYDFYSELHPPSNDAGAGWAGEGDAEAQDATVPDAGANAPPEAIAPSPERASHGCRTGPAVHPTNSAACATYLALVALVVQRRQRVRLRRAAGRRA
jgi:hypothetical protein